MQYESTSYYYSCITHTYMQLGCFRVILAGPMRSSQLELVL